MSGDFFNGWPEDGEPEWRRPDEDVRKARIAMTATKHEEVQKLRAVLEKMVKIANDVL